MRKKFMLITGAGRRLGAAMGKFFAAKNFAVVVHANNSVSQARELVDTIRKSSGDAFAVSGDLGSDEGFSQVVGAVADVTSSIDVLINNASHFEYDFPGKAKRDLLEKSFRVNIEAPFKLIEHYSSLSTERKKLDVFNILDQKLEAINPDYYSYTIGKAGLYAITKLWQSSGHRHVRVFGIMPGNFYPSGRQTEDEFNAGARANLLQRAPSAEDICDAIQFFTTHPGMPGQNLAVDAGERLAGRTRDPAYDPAIVPSRPVK
jgi:NAD(P)-dependent dehydrogenase (short-subunit alcohol dehydrogenase family)